MKVGKGPAPDISAHTPGTPRGEERIRREGREPSSSYRETSVPHRQNEV